MTLDKETDCSVSSDVAEPNKTVDNSDQNSEESSKNASVIIENEETRNMEESKSQLEDEADCDSGQSNPSSLDTEDETEAVSQHECDSGLSNSSHCDTEDDAQHLCACDRSNSRLPSSEIESEVDSDDSSSSAKQPILPMPMRPAFKPRGRMFKAPAAAAAPTPQFIMDVPEIWGVAADGSMMEMFNKLEVRE